MGAKKSKTRLNKNIEKHAACKVGLSLGHKDLKTEGSFQVGYSVKINKDYRPINRQGPNIEQQPPLQRLPTIKEETIIEETIVEEEQYEEPIRLSSSLPIIKEQGEGNG